MRAEPCWIISSEGAKGAGKIWKRSVEKLHMCYRTVISDGDSKTANNPNKVQPYGDQVKIVKHECVGHVQKRMSSHLRQLKKTRVVGVDDKVVMFGGKGRLAVGVIDQLGQFYGNAIRGHTSDLTVFGQMSC